MECRSAGRAMRCRAPAHSPSRGTGVRGVQHGRLEARAAEEQLSMVATERMAHEAHVGVSDKPAGDQRSSDLDRASQGPAAVAPAPRSLPGMLGLPSQAFISSSVFVSFYETGSAPLREFNKNRSASGGSRGREKGEDRTLGWREPWWVFLFFASRAPPPHPLRASLQQLRGATQAA